VKAAYRQRVKQVHPDYGGKHEDFLALQAAYEEALRLCRYGDKT
jgi:curved DNA-binding protein CbpA